VVLFVLAVIWAVYLASWVRSRSERRSVNSISSFNKHLSVLERTSPARQTGTTAARSTVVYPGYGPVMRRPAAMSRGEARRRRRDVLFVLAGVAAYSFWPRILSEARNIPASRSAPVAAEQPDVKSEYVRLRQLVYYRTNQPVGTIVVDKSQTFLYVVRPNVSALRYSIGVGKECTSLAGLYHVVRKETAANGDDGTKNLLGARVLYLDKEYRIHGSNASNVNVQQLPNGCIRLVNDDVIYLYDRTPLESRVVVSN